MALQDAHDGLQHIFEKALGAIGRFEAGNFSGWLAAIAHNHTMDYHRKNSYRWQHAVLAMSSAKESLMRFYGELLRVRHAMRYRMIWTLRWEPLLAA